MPRVTIEFTVQTFESKEEYYCGSCSGRTGLNGTMQRKLRHLVTLVLSHNEGNVKTKQKDRYQFLPADSWQNNLKYMLWS